MSLLWIPDFVGLRTTKNDPSHKGNVKEPIGRDDVFEMRMIAKKLSLGSLMMCRTLSCIMASVSQFGLNKRVWLIEVTMQCYRLGCLTRGSIA